jgi:3-hydroxymyristoyl/3-hydroxydecanoyl-(acyl carrier protein) dehydratase
VRLRFLFCDRILALEPGKHGLSSRTVNRSDEFLTEHYPLQALMPATLALECVAQLAGWLYIVTENFGINVVLAIAQGIEVFRHPRPGDTLIVEVWVDHAHKGGATLRGEARIGDETVLRARRLVFASQPSKPEDVEKARAMFNYVSGGFVVAKRGQD